MAQKRYREFVSVLYPESAKENWKTILEETCIPVFISPLHDQDCNPDGEIKKQHYHLMLMYTAPHSLDDAKAIFDSVGAVGIEVVKSHRGYARYLCHLDNPDKAPYSPDDVIALSGADYFQSIALPSDRYAVIKDMIAFVREAEIYEYSQLLEYAMEKEPNWFRSLCDNSTYVLKEYIKSRRFIMLDSAKDNSSRNLSLANTSDQEQ